VALAVTVTLLLVACDASLQNDQLGVTIDGNGRVHVRYLGCHDRQELVEGVEVLRVRGSLGGEDDEVVWRVHSTQADSVAELVVGVGGKGFEEDVPLAKALSGEYAIVVTTSRQGQVAQGVDVGGLIVGKIDTGLNVVSPAEFERQAKEACG
jgi:hypothetical protein